MIKVSLNNILNSISIFQSIMQQPCKGSIAFKIARLARELNKEIDTFDREKEKILKKFCELNENGELMIEENGNVKVLPEKIKDFNEEFAVLLNTEIEINADKIPHEAMDSFEITPQEMINLEVFFED